MALFFIVVLALIACSAPRLLQPGARRTSRVDASGAMKSMDGTPVSVDVTENPNGLFD